MIPKTIHYIWVGNNEIPDFYLECMSTWRKYAPEFDIILWNEEKIKLTFGNLDFLTKMLNKKKYAFASDYIRCLILERFGGIYLDTDIELIKDISELCNNTGFIGLESPGMPACGIMGAVNDFWFFTELKDAVVRADGLVTIPQLAKKILSEKGSLKEKNEAPFMLSDVKIFPEKYFYPYNPYAPNGRDQLMYKDITEKCYCIHHWAKSWKLSLIERAIKFLKKKLCK